MNSFEKFDQTFMLKTEYFYCLLRHEHIIDKDYQHHKNISE